MTETERLLLEATKIIHTHLRNSHKDFLVRARSVLRKQRRRS